MAHKRQSQILVLPATSTRLRFAQARQIVQTIIADDAAAHEETSEMLDRGNLFPWHIANRYYEAEVCFRISNVTLLQEQQPGSRAIERNSRVRTNQVRDTARGDIATSEADLDAQVRDVFATLELGPAPSRVAQLNGRSTADAVLLDDEHQRALEDDFDGVQAVVIIVDRNQPLAQHRKLLSVLETPSSDGEDEDAHVLLSGFNLAVSLIVALPSPLQDASGPTSLASITGADEVEALYSDAGWEYIDLAMGLDNHLEDDCDEGDNDKEVDADGSPPGEEEKQGFERIREALMTHTWPGLTRRHDRRSRSDTLGTSNHADESGDTNEGHYLQNTLSSLRTQLDAIDVIGTTEPTERDEELARNFLARIQAAQSAGLGVDDDIDAPLSLATGGWSAAPRSAAEMQADLERFLQSEDGQWPSRETAAVIGRTSHLSDATEDRAWAVTSDANARAASGDAFDDDFTEFVQAGLPTTNGHHDGAAIPLDDDELSFLGDEDDAVLLRALSSSQGAGGVSRSDVQIDFEATLSAVIAQAERVRAIADHEQRREEAARVALALLDQ